MTNPSLSPTLVGIAVVVEKLGVSRATIYRLLRTDPQFPHPVRFQGHRAVRWLLNEIELYIELAAKRRGDPKRDAQ